MKPNRVLAHTSGPDKRALGLLLRHLTVQQRTDLLTKGSFEVVSEYRRAYTITFARVYNVRHNNDHFCPRG